MAASDHKRLPPVPALPRFAAGCGRRRVGILGGSFNPAHAGHRAISLHALKALELDAVWWLITPQNPLKIQRPANMDKRLYQARHVARHPRITCLSLEQDFGTPYSVHTLRFLRQRNPETQFIWLMGGDNLQQLANWYHWPDIFRENWIAVFDRPVYNHNRLNNKAAVRFRSARLHAREARILTHHKKPAWVYLYCVLHPASSTLMRANEGTVWG